MRRLPCAGTVGVVMPPDPVLMHALRTAPAEKVRRALYAAMDALAEGQDWTEIERLVREHLSLPDALRILEESSGGAPAPTSHRPPASRRKRGR